MPFAYYGAKHGLAPKYPRPQYNTIIEPFAGSAGYSVRWASDSTRVILYDIDPAVVELWHRVQKITMAELNAITRHVEHDETTDDPLVAASAGGSGLKSALEGKTGAITPRMRKDWPQVRRRIWRALPRVSNWEIRHGTYDEAPNIEATWFVDPPYSVHDLGYTNLAHASGNAYRYGSSDINFKHLGDWCQSRTGQIIVCEQHPADWLPFTPFCKHKNAQNDQRTEVIWTNSPTMQHRQESIFNGE